MNSAIPYSLGRLAREIKPKVDLLADPLAKSRFPEEYSQAHDELIIILQNPKHWKALHTLKNGARYNRAVNQLGPKRMEWLEGFYLSEVKYIIASNSFWRRSRVRFRGFRNVL